MKKTYKPLAKQTKTATAFRRKTIDPRIDLGIKKDEDGLENIDDYWRVAGSILEADSMSEVEVKPLETREGKRVVIESLDSNIVEDGILNTTTGDEGLQPLDSSMVVNSTTINETNLDDFKFVKTQPKDCEGEDSTLYNIAEIKERLVGCMIPTRLSHKTPTRIETDPPSVSNTSGFEVTAKTENDESKGLETQNKDKEEMAKSKRIAFGNKKRKRITKQTKEDVKNDSVTKDLPLRDKIKSLGVQRETKQQPKAEPIEIGDNQIGLSNVSSFYTGKSEIFSLVKTDTFETASLYLNPEAKIVTNVALFSFTMFLVKGQLDLTVNGETFIIKRDSLIVIEKDSEYSITNKGQRVAEAIISYNIKKE